MRIHKEDRATHRDGQRKPGSRHGLSTTRFGRDALGQAFEARPKMFLSVNGAAGHFDGVKLRLSGADETRS